MAETSTKPKLERDAHLSSVLEASSRYRFCPRRATSLMRVVVAVLLCYMLPAYTAPIQYIYDEAGRLVGVIDKNGAAATYNYDAASNLVSVSPNAAVSIIEFTPNGGPTGTAVTISGTGFSATATQNTVKFNGTTATIVSASTTQLRVAVPSRATTGAISITTPSGTATSSISFVVGAASAGPTITSFTPTIGPAGTAISVTGTNFDITPGLTKASLNFQLVPLNTVTATNLGFVVPQVGSSGKISVATPNGSATSPQDFYLTPTPYGAANFAVTKRLSLGTAETFTVKASGAGKKALYLFDGTAGQRIDLQASSNTFASCVSVSLYGPDAQKITSSCIATPLTIELNQPFDQQAAFVSPPYLPRSATYTLLVEPTGTELGAITFNVKALNGDDLTGTITADGTPVNLSFPLVGQNGWLTFDGVSGQRVFLDVPTSTFAFNSTNVNGIMYVPGIATGTLYGNFIWHSRQWGMGASTISGPVTLPVSGTYTISLNPVETQTGNMLLRMFTLPPNLSGTASIGGAPFVVTTTAPGQEGSYTFIGSQGQIASLRITNNTFAPSGSPSSPSGVTIYLYKPSDPVNYINVRTTADPSFDMPNMTLPESGTYKIRVQGYYSSFGSITIQVTSP